METIGCFTYSFSRVIGGFPHKTRGRHIRQGMCFIFRCSSLVLTMLSFLSKRSASGLC